MCWSPELLGVYVKTDDRVVLAAATGVAGTGREAVTRATVDNRDDWITFISIAGLAPEAGGSDYRRW